MAGTYAAGVKSSRMAVVRDAIDAGSGAGYIEIGTASMASVLVKITFADPATTLSGAVLTGAGFPKSGTATGTGTAAEARIRDSSDADVRTGMTVGLAGAEVVVDSVNITSAQTVTLVSMTITHG